MTVLTVFVSRHPSSILLDALRAERDAGELVSWDVWPACEVTAEGLRVFGAYRFGVALLVDLDHVAPSRGLAAARAVAAACVDAARDRGIPCVVVPHADAEGLDATEAAP